MEIPLTATNHSHTPTRRHDDAQQLIQPTDRCKVCQATAGELASQLNRFNLALPVALASVFAERDLCSPCCMDLGRSTWAESKRGLGERTLAEQALSAGRAK